MAKQFFNYDPDTNITTWHEYFADTDETILSYTGGFAKSEAEASQTLKNDEDYTRKGMKKDMVHYAHISDEQLLKWHIEGINIKDTSELFRMVNKPEFSKLKTTTIYHKPKG